MSTAFLLSASLAEAQVDALPPSVVSQSPSGGATNAAPSVVVMATFSEPVQATSLVFELRAATSAPVPATVTYDAARRTVLLDPTGELTAGAYTATLGTAQDLAGNTLSAPVVWTFDVGTNGFQDPAALTGLIGPTAVRFAPDGRVFVAEKRGVIKVFPSLTDLSPVVFADLQTQVHDFGERGLLGLVLDPAFPTRPYVYVLYTYDAAIGGAAPRWGAPNVPGDPCPNLSSTGCAVSARLSRLTASGNLMSAEQVLIEDWFQQFPGQSIGDLAFGPDGALYASGGDGAHAALIDTGQFITSSPDPPNEGGALRSQDLQTPADPVTLSGTIIRVHPDTGRPLPRVPAMTIGTPTVDGNGVRSYLVTSGFLGSVSTTVRVLSPTAPASGMPPRLLYVLPVEAGVTNLSSLYSDGLEELRLLDVPNRFNATLIAPSFPIESWYGDHATDPTRRFEGFVVNELVPFGDSFAPTGTSPQRWLVGFSKSGHGALSLILRHPQVFSAAAAWDAPAQFTDLTAFQSLVDNFGTESRFDQYEIPGLVTRSALAFQQRPRLWISGDSSAWTTHMQQLDQQMTQAGVLHTYVATGPRAHGWYSGWLDGAVTALHAMMGTVAPIDPNEQRITAYGLRLPGRFTFRPGTSEIWLGDRGQGSVDEINRLTDPSDGTVDNFGWPCAVGSSPNSDYQGASICQGLQAPPLTARAPLLTYTAGQPLFAGDTCATANGGGITGVAFAGPSAYPASYSGALFLSDRLRRCVWAVPVAANGQPTPGAAVPVLSQAASPVSLASGPAGELFYADADGGTVRRLTYAFANQAPVAVIQAGPVTSGSSPLVVNFSATGSTDPEGAQLTYAWDLDGDGAFDDSTASQTSFTYSGYGRHTVLVRVQDPQGLSQVSAVDIITNNTAPVPAISTPATTVTWSVGQTIAFSGGATDPEDGVVQASRLTWSLIANHCPSACHTHALQDFIGVSAGSFVAPDHEYPSTLELRLTATDSLGVQSTTSVILQPRTVALTFESSPTGLQMTIGTSTAATPITRTVIVGSSNPVSVPSPQGSLTFTSWSDGGAQSHTIVAPSSAQTYTATFQTPAVPPGLVAAWGFNEGSGAVAQSAVGNFPGTIANATWTTGGRFGQALTFNGTNAMVTIADANALDLTTGMTLEAWVNPTATSGVRDILIKEGAAVDIYNLYARNGAGQPEANAFVGGTNRWATGATLPLNTWSHVAGTYDGTTVRLYVNGVQAGSLVFSGTIATSTGALRIGGNSLWGEFFQGLIDEVRIYSRALSATEIQADLSTPVGSLPDTTPPVLSNGQPTGTLPAGTAQTTISVTTNEAASCRYGTTAGVLYASLSSTLTTANGTTHTATVTGLVNGGSYSYYVRCQDTAGNTNASDTVIAFGVSGAGQDTTPPGVALTAPADGSTVAGIVTIAATASDNVGVAGVQFLLDGNNLGVEDTGAPFTMSWDTTALVSGSHVLSARARDLAGNLATSPTVGVAVVNGQVPANFSDEVVIGSGVTFPTAMEFLPDGRMLIAEFTGRVLIVPAGGSAPNSTPVLQLTNFFTEDVTVGGERGLVNVVADPSFATSGFIYLFYTAATPQRDRVSRFTMVGNTASLSSELVIWQGVANSTSTDHHGGGLAFGPDGKLYISTGDNGDPPSVQSLSGDHGKILRVNADGTVPTDNPFFDGGGGNIDAVWARGLRNPYRFSFDSATGRMYIGDVGLNTVEELNQGVAGANYGWPTCEGSCGTAGMTNPIFSYPHSGRDAAITGGFVYRGTQFPTAYQGAYFYGDFAQNWIRYLTLSPTGTVTGGGNFLPADGSLDGPYDPVMLKPGPDGSLYYVDFGWGWQGTANPASIRRIRYVAGNQPPVAVASATPQTGPAPLAVNFSSAGSVDPENQPLSYAWSFGDGATSTAANPVHSYAQPGQFTAQVVVSDGASSTPSQPLVISVGTLPVGTITSPINGATFRAGDVITFSGTAADAEDGPLSGASMTWTVLFRHDSHVHPAVPPTSGSTSGTFTIQTSGHDFSGATSYEIILTVIDSHGLQSTSSVTIVPQKVNLTFGTTPVGLSVTIDGISRPTPFVLDTLVGFQHVIGAPAQTSGSVNYTFGSWSDGGSQSHTIIAPAAAQTYTATFQAPPPLPDLVAAYSFNQGSGLSLIEAGGINANGTLVNGPLWTTGRHGLALDFDGINDHVVMSNPVNLPTGDFTVEAWIRLDATNDESIIMIPSTAGGNEFFMAVEGARVGAYVDGTRRARSAVSSVPALTWTHVAVTRAAGQIRIYLNGVPSGTTGNYAGAMDFGACPMYIGVDIDTGCNAAPGNYTDGLIDEVRIYRRALSQSEIQTDMNQPIGSLPDTTAPTVSNGTPIGTLAAGTTQTSLGVTTNEAAVCRYGSTPGVAYAAMTTTFASTGGTTHTSLVTGLANGGTYSYYVRCQDLAGNATTTDFGITFSVANPPPPDTTPPTISLTSPSPGATVSGVVTLTAAAADNVGVVGVQFLVDGVGVGAEDTTAPYSIAWSSTSVANGTHQLAARARDAAGNQTTATAVTVTVSNAAPSGLVAAWGFNEGSGTVVQSAVGNFPGAIGSATWTTSGRFGAGLSFNGTSAMVTVADANALDLTTGMTLEAWVYPTAATGVRDILIKEGTGLDIYNLYARNGAGQPEANVFVGGTNWWATGTTLPLNTWSHVAGTYDGTTVRLYINGVQAGTLTVGGSIGTSTGALRIGGNSLWGEFFQGLIDEVRIYNRALGVTELQADMNTPIVP